MFLLEGYTAREIGAKLGISHVMVLKSKNKLVNKSFIYASYIYNDINMALGYQVD